MKKILYGIAGLIAILIVAVLVVPGFIDWNDYKAEIAAEVKKATGRDVTLNGDLSLAILPSPRLSIADAHLSNIPGASARNMISLRELTVSVKFAPLLQGAIEIASVELVEPVIELEKFAGGTVNWTFVPANGRTPPPGTAAAKSSNGASKGSLRLDRLTIVNGKLIYRDAAAGTVEIVEAISLEGSAQSIIGPFAARGSLTARGVPLSLQVSTGKFAEKGTVPLSVEVKSPAASATVALKGTLTDAETAPRLSVKLDAEGPDIGALIAALTGAARPAAPARPFSVHAAVEASETAIAFNSLDVTIADTKASGSGRVGLGPVPRIEASLKTPLIDLNALLADKAGNAGAAAAPAPAPAGTGAGAAPGRSGTMAPAKSPSRNSALPAIPVGVEASVSLSAAEIAWKEGRARDATVVANLKDGVLSVDTLSVRLPGGAEIAMAARASGEKTPSYSGRLRVAAANLRATLAWIDANVAGVAADRLRRLSVNAAFSGNAEQLQVTGIDALIDTTRIAGGVTVALRDRPAFGASVSIDQINIDSYLPPKPALDKAPAGAAAPAKPGSAPARKAATPAKPAAGPGPFAALTRFDANLVLRAGRLVFQQSEIRDIAFDGTLQNGTFTIRDASVRNFAGTSAQVKGTVAGLAGNPSFNGTVAAASNDLTGLFRIAGMEPPVPASRLGAMSLAATTDLAGDRLALDAKLQLGDIRAALKGTGTGISGAPAFDMGLDIAHPDFRELVRLFDPEFNPRNPNLGDFRVATRLQGDMESVKLDKITGNVGKTTVTGSGSARLATPRPVVDLDLKSGVLSVSDFRRPRPGAGTRAGSPPATTARPPQTAGNAAAAGQKSAGAPSAAAPASGRWSRQEIDTTVFGLVDATIDLGAEALLYDALRVDRPKIVAVLKDKVLDVRQVSGAMFDGSFELKGRLDARAAPAATMSVNVAKANVNKLLFEAAAFDIASGVLDFRMDIETAGATQFDMVSSLAGSGRIDVAEGVVKGFDLRGVSDSLKKAGRIDGLFGILGAAMGGGSTKFHKLDGTFKIDKGVMRTDNLTLSADAGAGTATGFVDLPAWNMDMAATFQLTEHPKAPVFKARASGPPDSPKRTFDFNELQQWVLNQGVGGLLKNLVPGLSGGDSPESQQKATDVLKGLLKGLKR